MSVRTLSTKEIISKMRKYNLKPYRMAKMCKNKPTTAGISQAIKQGRSMNQSSRESISKALDSYEKNEGLYDKENDSPIAKRLRLIEELREGILNEA